MRLIDIIAFLCVLTGVLLAGRFFVFPNTKEKLRGETMDFRELLGKVREMLNEYVGYSDTHPGFTGTVAKSSEASTATVVNAVRECCSGSAGAREIVCELIEGFLVSGLKLKEKDMDLLLNEADPIVAFYEIIEALRGDYGEYSFKHLWDSFLKNRANLTMSIEAEHIFEAKTFFNVRLDKYAKRKVLAEILYIYTAGLGAIDTLNWQKGCIEEIQLGLSGVSRNLYDYRDELKNIMGTNTEARNLSSKDSVHAVIEGKLYRLAFVSFGTEDELIRILRNLVLNAMSPELTRKNPMLVVDTPDGRRVSVSRPPLTDAWVGLIRKFDTVSVTNLNELVHDERARKILHEIIGNNGSIGVTGEMASGKTTLLRALLLEIGEKDSIRVIEADSFELNVREYLPKANTLTMRVSQEFSEDKVLSFAKKTTGRVFAVGEITSPYMANLAINVSKYAKLVLFTAHYKSTEDMIADFTGARINAGGLNDEKAARTEALKMLRYDVHIVNINGGRHIEYINEVVADGSVRCLYRA